MFFRPDSTIFPKVEFDADVIAERLEVSSYLHKGVRIVFENEETGDKKVYQHTEGLADYLKKILTERTAAPVHEAAFTISKESDESGLRLDLAMQWTQSTDEHVRSYVNGIPTGSGGTHENGFRAGLGKAVRNFIDTHNLSPKGVTLAAEDIREGLVAVLSVFVQEPQFQGQTKDRLNNPEVMSAVDSQVRPALEHWLNTNISVAESIVAQDHPGRARARGEPRRATGSGQENGDLQPPHAARQAQRLHLTPAATTASCSSSKEIRRADRPSRGGTAQRRRSSRFAARSSTPKAPRSRKFSRTRSSPIS